MYDKLLWVLRLFNTYLLCPAVDLSLIYLGVTGNQVLLKLTV